MASNPFDPNSGNQGKAANPASANSVTASPAKKPDTTTDKSLDNKSRADASTAGASNANNASFDAEGRWTDSSGKLVLKKASSRRAGSPSAQKLFDSMDPDAAWIDPKTGKQTLQKARSSSPRKPLLDSEPAPAKPVANANGNAGQAPTADQVPAAATSLKRTSTRDFAPRRASREGEAMLEAATFDPAQPGTKSAEKPKTASPKSDENPKPKADPIALAAMAMNASNLTAALGKRASFGPANPVGSEALLQAANQQAQSKAETLTLAASAVSSGRSLLSKGRFDKLQAATALSTIASKGATDSAQATDKAVQTSVLLASLARNASQDSMPPVTDPASPEMPAAAIVGNANSNASVANAVAAVQKPKSESPKSESAAESPKKGHHRRASSLSQRRRSSSPTHLDPNDPNSLISADEYKRLKERLAAAADIVRNGDVSDEALNELETAQGAAQLAYKHRRASKELGDLEGLRSDGQDEKLSAERIKSLGRTLSLQKKRSVDLNKPGSPVVNIELNVNLGALPAETEDGINQPPRRRSPSGSDAGLASPNAGLPPLPPKAPKSPQPSSAVVVAQGTQLGNGSNASNAGSPLSLERRASGSKRVALPLPPVPAKRQAQAVDMPDFLKHLPKASSESPKEPVKQSDSGSNTGLQVSSPGMALAVAPETPKEPEKQNDSANAGASNAGNAGNAAAVMLSSAGQILASSPGTPARKKTPPPPLPQQSPKQEAGSDNEASDEDANQGSSVQGFEAEVPDVRHPAFRRFQGPGNT